MNHFEIPLGDEQDAELTEVSVSINADGCEVTRMDEMLPFHSTSTFEDMEKYCEKNNYDIRIVYGEDGEAW